MILKHHLGAPFVFSGEVSERLSLGVNLIRCFPMNWSVYARSEHTVNNKRVMLHMKQNLRTDTLHFSFSYYMNPFIPSHMGPGRIVELQREKHMWSRNAVGSSGVVGGVSPTKEDI